MTAAQITPEEWRNHLELEGRVLGEYHRLAKTTELLTNQTAKLTAVVEKLERRLNKAERRQDSWEDLDEQAKMAALIQDNKRLRSLPHQVLKYAGLALGVCAAGLEVAHRLGLLK